MIIVKIGPSEQNFETADRVDENWINRQLQGQRGDIGSVCVRVRINEGPVHMSLTTPTCASSGGGFRPPNSEEEKVFDLWERLGLNRKNFQEDSLIAFFKQVRRITS
jgi:hypothetical protein